MQALDFFIKESKLLPIDDLYKSRIIVMILIVMGMIPALMLISTNFGYYENEYPIPYIILILTSLATMKFRGSLDVTLFILLTMGSVLVGATILNTGMGASFNTKWFVVLFIFAGFINSRWL